MRTNKNTSKIILAVTVAFLAMIISYSAFSNMHKQLTEQQKLIELMQKTKSTESKGDYAYAVALKDLKAGEIVSDQDVDFKQFSQENSNAFENRSDVVNKVLLQDISSGNMFTSAHIAKISSDEVSLKEGYRALTLPADNFQGKSQTMKQGSLVDIYSESSNNNWVLENVRIISFGDDKKGSTSANSSTDIMNASEITFEVSADDISDFISNTSKGKLVLVARSANDKMVVHKKAKRSPNRSSNVSSNYIPSYGSNYDQSYGSSYEANYNYTPSSLPKLPASVPVSNLSKLPRSNQSSVGTRSVELIEANVKSKVTFD